MLSGLEAVFFYLFAFIAVAAAFMVISARNPVHSVLYLILTFVNAAGLFLLTGAEFLAMILLVVYVGAVAVLFLFVVMMLDVDFAELRERRAALCADRRDRRADPGGRADRRHRRLRLRAAACLHGREADARHRRPPQYGGARRHPLYGLHLLLPDRGPGASGRHDRRDRADAAAQARRQAAGYFGAGPPHAGDRDRNQEGRDGQGHLTCRLAFPISSPFRRSCSRSACSASS